MRPEPMWRPGQEHQKHCMSGHASHDMCFLKWTRSCPSIGMATANIRLIHQLVQSALPAFNNWSYMDRYETSRTGHIALSTSLTVL